MQSPPRQKPRKLRGLPLSRSKKHPLPVNGYKKPKPRDLKLIPDFADRVNDIIWRLEDLFFVKKKRYVNPVMTEAGKYIMDDNRVKYICLKMYSISAHQGKCGC